MPVFRDRMVLHVARNLKAFLNLEAGVTRGEVPGAANGEEIEGIRRRLASSEAELARLRSGPTGARPAADGPVRAENVVWLFCTGRSGSTWLSNMMGDVSGHEVWKEPKIGQLFGDFYYVQTVEKQHRAKKFILGNGREEVWLRSIRSMVLDGAGSLFPGLGADGKLVVKEPGGAVGAPLLMRALPESRMILLVRDPRDVVSSVLDGVRKGGWIYNWRDESDRERDGLAEQDPLAFVAERATGYLQQISNAKEAYDAHGGPKALVRYEDLLADTLGEMERIYAELGIGVDREELSRVVAAHAWDNVPEEQKGQGKFYRKASPGGWREDLTPEQAETVGRITAPLLEAFYP